MNPNQNSRTILSKLVHSLVLMVVLAFGLRVVGIVVLRTYNFSTSKSPFSTTPAEFSFGYETGSIAASLARGQGFSSPFGHPTGPTAWIAPVYPTLVAGVFKLLGVYSKESAIAVLSLNSLFSALTCIPMVLIGRRTVGNSPGLLAGWLWAVLPIYMKWPITWVWDMSISALLMTTLVLLTLDIVETKRRRLWIAYGVLWGIAALTNPALLSILPLSLFWVAIKLRRVQRGYIRPLFLVMVTFVACAAPWIIRNQVVLGKPVFFRDNFWFEFHLGNYHLSNGMGWGGKHPTLNHIQLDFYTNAGELKYIEHYRAESIEFVREYPKEFVDLTMKRFTAFWNGDFFNYLYPRWWQIPAYVSVSALAILGLLLALGNRIYGAFVFVSVLLCYPVVYYLTYPGSRYRYAIEPEMLILSSYFLCELVRNFHSRFSRHQPMSTEAGSRAKSVVA